MCVSMNVAASTRYQNNWLKGEKWSYISGTSIYSERGDVNSKLISKLASGTTLWKSGLQSRMMDTLSQEGAICLRQKMMGTVHRWQKCGETDHC